MDRWQALAVVDLLAAEGVVGWIDGGWGVDALLGELTRPHADLDLAIDERAVDRLVTRLRAHGYTVLRDQLPVAVALRHGDGREVDLHPLALTPDGGGDEQQPDGGPPWHYGPAGDRPHRRPAGALQQPGHPHPVTPGLPAHSDHADMRALAHHFGCPLPAPYDCPGFGPALDPESQLPSGGQLYGRVLLAAVHSGLADLGYQIAVLRVLPGNQRARTVYEHYGWHYGAYRTAEGFGVSLPDMRYQRKLP